jgi:hypothetical protein
MKLLLYYSDGTDSNVESKLLSVCKNYYGLRRRNIHIQVHKHIYSYRPSPVFSTYTCMWRYVLRITIRFDAVPF